MINKKQNTATSYTFIMMKTYRVSHLNSNNAGSYLKTIYIKSLNHSIYLPLPKLALLANFSTKCSHLYHSGKQLLFKIWFHTGHSIKYNKMFNENNTYLLSTCSIVLHKPLTFHASLVKKVARQPFQARFKWWLSHKTQKAEVLGLTSLWEKPRNHLFNYVILITHNKKKAGTSVLYKRIYHCLYQW